MRSDYGKQIPTAFTAKSAVLISLLQYFSVPFDSRWFVYKILEVQTDYFCNASLGTKGI